MPSALPVRIPEEVDVNVAFVLLLLQVPPVGVLLNDVVIPRHTIRIPVIGVGIAVTETTVVA